MYIISNYHEFKSEEFKFEIVSEDDIYYYVRFFPEYRDKFQDGYSVLSLEKRLVHEDSIYLLVDETINVQLSLFDL